MDNKEYQRITREINKIRWEKKFSQMYKPKIEKKKNKGTLEDYK